MLGSLLLIGAAVHACGSFAAYPMGSLTLVWSLSGSGLAALLAVLNLLRAARPQDRTLAWICAGGCLFWALIGLAFGFAIDHLLDPQVVFHVVVAAALADCSVVTAMRKDATPAETSSSPVIAAPAVRAVELPVSVLVRSPPRRPHAVRPEPAPRERHGGGIVSVDNSHFFVCESLGRLTPGRLPSDIFHAIARLIVTTTFVVVPLVERDGPILVLLNKRRASRRHLSIDV